MRSSRPIRRIAAVLSVLLPCGALLAREEERLNVVVLVSDDQRFDSLGCTGSPVVRTPHLDSLAASGVRFAEARVSSSICMVSRASILTGQHMARHGIRRFGVALEPEAFAETYPALLRAAGYWSGFVGKYGVGGIRRDDFDFVRAYEVQHWFDQPDGTRLHVTERNERDALEFLRERPHDRPFLLSLSFFAAHAEDAAPEQYLPQPWSAALYEGVTVPRSVREAPVYLEALPEFLRAPACEGRVRFGWRFDTPEHRQRSLIDYFRLITELDRVVGHLVEELKAQGELERTLILFVGDNGYFLGDRGLADKWFPYEEALRVPFLVFDPRLPAAERGQVRSERVLALDVAATVLGAAGLARPARMQGEDVAELYLGGRTTPWRTEFLYEHPTITSRERIPASQAVVRPDVEYVLYPEWQHEQLFDLVGDPTQLHDRAQDPAEAERLAELRARLAELLREAQ